MDDDAALAVLRSAADGLADAAARNLERPLPTYPGWSVADVVVHTGRIHRWVAEIVRTRAAERLPQPAVEPRPEDPVGWFRAGAATLADALAATDPATPVWTFAGQPTAAFWRRRMALETTIHRWDVQRACGEPAPIAEAVAVAGVSEALEVYLHRALRDADLGCGGVVVGLRADPATPPWVLRLRDDGIDLLGADAPVDVWLDAAPDQLWLFLMGRAGPEVLTCDGPDDALTCLARAVGLLAAPAR
jgi:uncharacterized protein (TIGR03083 family)